MVNKYDAKFLENVIRMVDLKKSLKYDEERLELFNQRLEGVGSIDYSKPKVSTSIFDQGRREQLIDEKNRLEKLVEYKFKVLDEHKKKYQKDISEVTDERIKNVLWYRVALAYTWWDVAYFTFYSEQHCQRLYRQGIRVLTKINESKIKNNKMLGNVKEC